MRFFLKAFVICTIITGISYSLSTQDAYAQYYIKKESEGSNFFSRLFGWGKKEQKQKTQTQKQTSKTKKKYKPRETTTNRTPLSKDRITDEEIRAEFEIMKNLQTEFFGNCTQADRERIAEFEEKKEKQFKNLEDPAYRKKMSRTLGLPEDKKRVDIEDLDPEEFGLESWEDEELSQENLDQEWQEKMKAISEEDEFFSYMADKQALEKQMQSVFRCKSFKEIIAEDQKQKQEYDKKKKKSRR